jgi:hypothetical protein
MRCLVVLTLLLTVAVPASAGDKSKPNTLTPKEVADGWLSLFDGTTTFGWKIDGPHKVVDGTLELGGDKETVATLTTEFGYCEFHFQFNMEQRHGELTLNQFKQRIDQWHFRGGLGEWRQVHAKVEPAMIRYEILGEGYSGGRQDVNSRTALAFRVRPGEKLALRDLKLRPTQLTSIYNGKDLTGWRVFANKKSKFTVNDKGELNIKDGPGDLQTEGKYGDFVLQLECISNGKHLNSGVFFRCRPNEYQNGYEAQIRNQFTAEATQEYAIEDYDPVTHKLLGKTKIKSSAVDFGTGAIYRRVPARKGVAKDNEWLTMTIVAHGKHMATWVNGVQVADWTDHRPPSDNARTGCRLEAGHISLQGHDPTTDLSFRNFRIAEMPAAMRK